MPAPVPGPNEGEGAGAETPAGLHLETTGRHCCCPPARSSGYTRCLRACATTAGREPPRCDGSRGRCSTPKCGATWHEIINQVPQIGGKPAHQSSLDSSVFRVCRSQPRHAAAAVPMTPLETLAACPRSGVLRARGGSAIRLHSHAACPPAGFECRAPPLR